MTYRNFTGGPFVLMGTNGSNFGDVPTEPRTFYGGANDTLWTKDLGSLNVAPFSPTHLPPPQAEVVLIVRPEVAARVRAIRPDVWDGSTPR
jgi:hypothetical protein